MKRIEKKRIFNRTLKNTHIHTQAGGGGENIQDFKTSYKTIMQS